MRIAQKSITLMWLLAAVGLAGFAAGADSGATLVLPAKIVAGERATLAVLDAEGRLAPGARVEFSGGVALTTDETGRASFTAPEQPGVITVQLAGGPPATTTVVRATDHPTGELVIDDVPALVALGDRFRVGGFGFRGEADANSVQIGEREAVVLAASPLELLLTPGPGAEPGQSELRVATDGQQAEPISVTLVGLDLSADRASLAPKEKGKLTIRVHGTFQKVDIEARNMTPDVVRVRNGDVQRLTTRGGEENIATLDLEGLRAGVYSIVARMVPQPAGLPNTEAALRHLIRAMRLAPNEELRLRIQRQSHRIEQHAQNAPRVRNELERLLEEVPAGEFREAIQAAYKALLKR